MRKVLVMFTAVALSFALVGCGGDKPKPAAPTTPPAAGGDTAKK
jgi:hypothetical protein